MFGHFGGPGSPLSQALPKQPAPAPKITPELPWNSAPENPPCSFALTQVVVSPTTANRPSRPEGWASSSKGFASASMSHAARTGAACSGNEPLTNISTTNKVPKDRHAKQSHLHNPESLSTFLTEAGRHYKPVANAFCLTGCVELHALPSQGHPCT